MDRSGTAHDLPVASRADTLRALGAITPIVAQGVIARRRRIVALAGRLDTDARGIRTFQHLSDRYGRGPVRLRTPVRRVAVVLEPQHARDVLDATPEPFAADTWEKHGALAGFQPHGVLVSRGAMRAERRTFNEAVLDTGHPLHHDADTMARVVREEIATIGDGVLDWDTFIPVWWRIVRRIVLGDGARDDHRLTDDLTRLRHRGNWSVLLPGSAELRARFRTRLTAHVERADRGSLAAMVARMPAPPGLDPVDQIPQWLFAYDPAGAVTLRALALLAAHPDEFARVRDEIGSDPSGPRDLPRLRAAVLESVRLWPTTPLLLRETTDATRIGGGILPARTGVVIPTWYLHRDERVRADAHRYHPDQWLDDSADEDPALVPFSAGPARCPGRELVLFTASTVLAELLRGRDADLRAPHLPAEALPAGLDPFTTRVRLRQR